MIRWRVQDNRPVCGQVAIAVLGDMSVADAVEFVGHEGPTTTKELARALRRLGYKCGSRCRRMSERPPLALAQVRRPEWGRDWHWVVVKGDKIYDGNFGSRNGTVRWPSGARITSYLPVEKR